MLKISETAIVTCRSTIQQKSEKHDFPAGPSEVLRGVRLPPSCGMIWIEQNLEGVLSQPGVTVVDRMQELVSQWEALKLGNLIA
jgi:hypothetical protein